MRASGSSGAGRFHWRTALGLTAGGIPGVIVAVWLVKSLPLDALRWLVLLVVIYAAVSLLRAGLRAASGGHVPAAGEASSFR